VEALSRRDALQFFRVVSEHPWYRVNLEDPLERGLYEGGLLQAQAQALADAAAAVPAKKKRLSKSRFDFAEFARQPVPRHIDDDPNADDMRGNIRAGGYTKIIRKYEDGEKEMWGRPKTVSIGRAPVAQVIKAYKTINAACDAHFKALDIPRPRPQRLLFH